MCVVQDADLLLLSLLCHKPYFTVMRESMEAGVRQGGAQMLEGGSLGGRDVQGMVLFAKCKGLRSSAACSIWCLIHRPLLGCSLICLACSSKASSILAAETH